MYYFSTDVCAGDDGKGICRVGDYGGSLIVQEDGHYAVVGVISWGVRCAEPGFPGIYARVTARLDWILANTEGTQDTSCATTTTVANTSAINNIITITQNTTSGSQNLGCGNLRNLGKEMLFVLNNTFFSCSSISDLQCPARDIMCIATDRTNLVKNVTTMSDVECGCK